jgi:MFS family permease
MFRALSHRNFRLFWAGAFLSNAGTWMQSVAQGWLVLKLTNSPFWLGFDGFMAMLPGLLLTLVGGVFADLVDRKRLLIYTQVGAGLTALVLFALMAAGILNDASDVWMILLLSFATGCCMAIGGPSFQAITFDMVGREDLANAVALNSAQFQLSRVIGPLLAGVTIQIFGLAGCFLVNGLSYVAIVAALSRVRFEDKTEGETTAAEAGASTLKVAPAEHGSLWQDLLEGFRYVRGRPRVLMLLLATAVTSLFGSPYITMIPLFARNVMGWGETGLSLMMGTSGAGAFLGAMMVAYLGDFKNKGWFVLGSVFAAAICLIAFALSSHWLVSLLMLFALGFAMVNFFSVTNTLLQQLVQDQMRGRVMSMWILSFIGSMPIGSLVAGAAAERFGAQWTLAVGGLIILVFVVFVSLRNARLGEL